MLFSLEVRESKTTFKRWRKSHFARASWGVFWFFFLPTRSIRKRHSFSSWSFSNCHNGVMEYGIIHKFMNTYNQLSPFQMHLKWSQGNYSEKSRWGLASAICARNAGKYDYNVIHLCKLGEFSERWEKMWLGQLGLCILIFGNSYIYSEAPRSAQSSSDPHVNV